MLSETEREASMNRKQPDETAGMLRLRPNVGERLMRIHNLPSLEMLAQLLGEDETRLRAYLEGQLVPTPQLIAAAMRSGLGAAEVIEYTPATTVKTAA